METFAAFVIGLFYYFAMLALVACGIYVLLPDQWSLSYGDCVGIVVSAWLVLILCPSNSD